MTRLDYVSEVLSIIGNNWDTNNHSPQPVRYNRNDRVRLDTGERTKGVPLTESNVVSVDSTPTTTKNRVGTEFDHVVNAGVGVRVEGLHQDAGGDIADDDDFNSLVEETRRAILLDREQANNPGVWFLDIGDENNETPTSNRDEWHHFEVRFPVWFWEYESLP